jgi:hypothetical protein
MKLLSRGVAVAKVGEVMKNVAEFCGKTLSTVPSATTIKRMGNRRASVCRQQLADVLPQQTSTTALTDKTRKKGDSFEAFAMQDSSGQLYVLGLRDMADKSANSCLDTLKTLVGDLDNASHSDAARKIVANIKNPMSNRSSENKFHALLEDYRTELLPDFVRNWTEFSEEEKTSLSNINNFFCGLHILVNFAEVATKTLQQFEGATEEDGEKASSGAVESVRKACKRNFSYFYCNKIKNALLLVETVQ